MKTTIMFVADSIPLGDARVRLEGGEAEAVWVTDAEGKIELDLDLGAHTFQIEAGGEWLERTINRQGSAPLFVVNVRGQDARQVTTLNTLQIDLSNLVGDRYVFETVLGRGGMGVVVKAIDRMLNRPVAIKMLSDELRENEEAQQIFLVEARNLATLSHPNLVAIHDILNVGGRVLMVFEYVLGENVEKTIKKKGRISQTEVLKVAIQLTRCVAYLHEHDLIHRDLKPANIIMQGDGTLKLIDFGLARSLNEIYVRGTRVRGTPAYMAPEQIQGIHLTTATDIYQLGISIYEMLRGKLPFSTGDMAYAHVHLEPPPLTQHVPDIDAELARLVHACLAKQPRDRPGGADVLLEQLQQIYARLRAGESQQLKVRQPPRAEPPPAPRPSAPMPEPVALDDVSLADEFVGGSNRGLAGLAVIGIAALALAIWAIAGGARKPVPPAPETTPVVATTVEPETDVDNAEPAQPIDRSVLAAQGLIGLSVATATGRASGIAVRDPEAEPAAPPRARVARAREPKRAHAPVAAVATAAAEPVAPSADPKPEPEPKPKPTAKPRRKNGLLSVEDDRGHSLLPVNN